MEPEKAMKILTDEKIRKARLAMIQNVATVMDECTVLEALDHRTKERDRLMEAVEPIPLSGIACVLENKGHAVYAEDLYHLAATVKEIQKEELCN
jgi:hypothetical protein